MSSKVAKQNYNERKKKGAERNNKTRQKTCKQKKINISSIYMGQSAFFTILSCTTICLYFVPYYYLAAYLHSGAANNLG